VERRVNDKETREAALRVFQLCRARGFTLTTAESCTGGMVAAAITDIPGSSDVVDRGFVTYSNEAKMALLGVSKDLLAQSGAVSAECAKAMALGALNAAGTSIAVSITGIAGPGGGSPEKPVGLVYMAAASREAKFHARECRFGDPGRDEIRRRSVIAAFALIEELLDAPIRG
jgi:nicotinamide-nucleotide amidase